MIYCWQKICGQKQIRTTQGITAYYRTKADISISFIGRIRSESNTCIMFTVKDAKKEQYDLLLRPSELCQHCKSHKLCKAACLNEILMI